MKKRKADKKDEPDEIDEMRPEYDFTNGVRGKHADLFPQGDFVLVFKPGGADVYSCDSASEEMLRKGVIIRRKKSRAESKG